MTDQDILWPEQEVIVGDETTVTVHEMTFAQTARLAEDWQPIAEEVMGSLGSASEDEVIAMFDDLAERHGERLIRLIAATARVDDQPVSREWVERLKPDDGMILAVAWLGVHLRFFGARRAGRQTFRDRLLATSRSLRP